MAVNFDIDDIETLEPWEIAGDAALHLYDFYFRPKHAYTPSQQPKFRQWLETTPEGQAYALIVEKSPNPVKTRAYIVRYAS